MSRSRSFKGQLSFEFIIILALFLGVTAVISNDFFEQSANTVMFSAVRQSADMLINEQSLLTPSCTGSYINYIVFDEALSTIDVYIKGAPCCHIDPLIASRVAYVVEKSECGNKYLVYDPLDTQINCSSKQYYVGVYNP